MQLDECLKLPADARRDRSRHAIVAALGASAVETRLRRRARAGGPCSASCRAATIKALRERKRAGAHRYRLRRLRHRRARGGRAAGRDAQDRRARPRRMLPADRPRYLMGVGTPRRSVAGGGARHRHVRLRAADPQRPPRHGVHALRARSISPMPATPTTRVRSTKKARIRRRGPIRAPICII